MISFNDDAAIGVLAAARKLYHENERVIEGQSADRRVSEVLRDHQPGSSQWKRGGLDGEVASTCSWILIRVLKVQVERLLLVRMGRWHLLPDDFKFHIIPPDLALTLQ